jgi:hypothetical protein
LNSKNVKHNYISRECSGIIRFYNFKNELAARQIASAHCTGTSDARARVLKPLPATVPSLQNTCFFASPDSAIVTIFHTIANPGHLPGLWHLLTTLSYRENHCPFIGTLTQFNNLRKIDENHFLEKQ